MPFYYDCTRPCTTNGTTLTLTTHFRIATVANQLTARIVALYGAAKGSAAGGGVVKLTRAGTIGSGGTAVAAPNGINKRNPDNPTAGTTVFTDATAITPGATPSVQLNVGFAQTGGQGAWVALEPDNAVMLKANGTANGNAEIGTLAVGLSQAVEVGFDFSES